MSKLIKLFIVILIGNTFYVYAEKKFTDKQIRYFHSDYFKNKKK